jgi:hypothetical protein
MNPYPLPLLKKRTVPRRRAAVVEAFSCEIISSKDMRESNLIAISAAPLAQRGLFSQLFHRFLDHLRANENAVEPNVAWVGRPIRTKQAP